MGVRISEAALGSAGIAVLLLAAATCGGGTAGTCRPGEEVCGPVEQNCRAIADRYCCGLEGDEHTSCVIDLWYVICTTIGSAPEGGCANGGPCVRSSVDFDACQAALDAYNPDDPERLCETACYPGDPLGTCDGLPLACETNECIGSDCAEQCAAIPTICDVEICTNPNQYYDCPERGGTDACEGLHGECIDWCNANGYDPTCSNQCARVREACADACTSGATCAEACTAASAACDAACVCAEDP